MHSPQSKSVQQACSGFGEIIIVVEKQLLSILECLQPKCIQAFRQGSSRQRILLRMSIFMCKVYQSDNDDRTTMYCIDRSRNGYVQCLSEPPFYVPAALNVNTNANPRGDCQVSGPANTFLQYILYTVYNSLGQHTATISKCVNTVFCAARAVLPWENRVLHSI